MSDQSEARLIQAVHAELDAAWARSWWSDATEALAVLTAWVPPEERPR